MNCSAYRQLKQTTKDSKDHWEEALTQWERGNQMAVISGSGHYEENT